MTEYQPTPQTPEQVADGLRNAMKQAKEDGVFEMTDEEFQKTLDLIKQYGEDNKPPCLWSVIRDKLGFSVDMSYEIVDAVAEWLPKEHDTNSYEWNKCLKMIRGNLYD